MIPFSPNLCYRIETQLLEALFQITKLCKSFHDARMFNFPFGKANQQTQMTHRLSHPNSGKFSCPIIQQSLALTEFWSLSPVATALTKVIAACLKVTVSRAVFASTV